MGIFSAPAPTWGYAGKVNGLDRNGYYVGSRMVGYVDVIGQGGKAYYQGQYLGYLGHWQGAQAKVESTHTAAQKG